MKLYTKNQQERLSRELFQNPSAEYRGAPFWAWNCKMTKERVVQGYAQLQEMGMGGAHLHCRTGLDTPYLSEEFMDLVDDEVYGKRKGGICCSGCMMRTAGHPDTAEDL